MTATIIAEQNPGMTAPLGRGVWGVLATPFQGSTLDICETSLARAVEYYVGVGVTGLTVLGVFGEAAQLSLDEQRQVLEIVSEVRGELPIVVGLPGQGTRVAIEQGLMAVEATGGTIAGLMLQVNTPNPVALGKHLRAVHEQTGAGIVVQDYPLITGVRITQADLARTVSDNADLVVAVKSESPPTAPATATLTAATSAPVFGGLGGVGLLDELECGAAGAMTGFSFPEALIATVAAYAAGGFAAARATFAPWLPLVNFEAQPGISLAVRKECLRVRGLFLESAVRPPAAELPESLTGLVKQHLSAAQSLLER